MRFARRDEHETHEVPQRDDHGVMGFLRRCRALSRRGVEPLHSMVLGIEQVLDWSKLWADTARTPAYPYRG